MELELLSVVAAPTAPVDTVNPIARLDTYVALLAGLIALGACGGDDDPVVARVGDAEIHASRLARFVERLPEGLRSQQQGLPAIREHLSSIVDQELLLAEVAARGIDDDIEVLRELNTRARSRLSQLYLTRQLMSSEDLPAEEVERVFRERGHDRQRLLARILVPSRAEARQVAARFDTDREAADSFGDVAERYSDNDPSAGEQGELAWIGIDDLGAFRIPEHVFFSLADGRVADEPVDLGGMWQVYSFRDSRKRGLSEVWEEFHDRLLRERWHRRLRLEYENLARRFGLEVAPEGLEILLAVIRETGKGRLEVTPSQAEAPLYNYSDAVITVGDYVAQLRGIGALGQLRDSTSVAWLAERMVLPERLYAAAASEEGWNEEQGYVEYYDRERHEVLLKALAADEVDRQGGVSAEDVLGFYEAEPNLFLRTDEVVIRRLYVHSQEKAKDLRRQLEEGVSMDQLLELPEVAHHVHPRTRGHTRLFPIHRSHFPELVEAAFGAEIGDLVGPVPMAEGWVVFVVLDKLGGEVQPFEVVRQRALGMLRQRREFDSMSGLIRQLRSERADSITLFPERVAHRAGT